MKLAQILTFAWFSTSISALLFSNSSIERNVSITHRAGLPVDNLKFSAETVGSKSPPGPDVVQIAGSTWDPKNFATPEAWEKYAGKGGWLNCLFAMSDEEAGAAWPDPLGRTPKSASSQWLGTLENEMCTWAWREGFFNQEGCEWVTGAGLGREVNEAALKGLGLSATAKASGGDNVCYFIEHGNTDAKDKDGDELVFEDQYYTVNEKKYSCTGAEYFFAINHVGGAIIAMLLENPLHAANNNREYQDPDDTNLPQLRRASDIMFAFWLRNNPDPKNLNNYIVNDVRNDETMPIIASLLAGRGITTVPFWPGRVALKMGDQDFAKVVLGTPIGATLGHMLLQHKKELGRKHVTEVLVFRDELKKIADQPAVQIVFRIEDVPPPEPEKPGTPGEKPDEEMPDVQGPGGVQVRHVVRRDDGNGMLRVHEFRLRSADWEVKAS